MSATGKVRKLRVAKSEAPAIPKTHEGGPTRDQLAEMCRRQGAQLQRFLDHMCRYGAWLWANGDDETAIAQYAELLTNVGIQITPAELAARCGLQRKSPITMVVGGKIA